MSVHLCTASIQAATNLPEDAMVNTFYFEGSGADPTNVFDMVTDFYEDVPTGATRSIFGWMGQENVGDELTLTLYDLADSPPRAPIATSTRTIIGPGTGECLPSEVALCLSYQTSVASGQPQARRRGRIYIGGLLMAASQDSRPVSGIITTLACAGRDLIQASNASVSWEWQQYSRTNAAGNIVTGGWVDNAWDTQRRRGLAPSARTLWDGGTP